MAELNLSTPIVAPQAAAAAASRGNDAGSATDGVGSPFSNVMSQTQADGAAAPADTSAAPTQVDTGNGRASDRGAHKDKTAAEKIAGAHDRQRSHGRLLESNGKVKDAKSAAGNSAATADGNQRDASAPTLASANAALLPLPATAVPVVAVPLVAANAAAAGRQDESESPKAVGKHGARAHSSRAGESAADPAPAASASGQPLDPASARAGHQDATLRSVDHANGDGGAAHAGDRPAQGPGDGRAVVATNANAAQAAPRDRLNEDFQQRFERALTVAASTTPPSASEAGRMHAAAPQVWAAGPVHAPTHESAVQITIPTPVGVTAFAEDFSNRVALLTHGKVHSAELSLTPADLGPVRVTIEVHGTEAKLVFGAAHPATRSAIEEALPRLREMLNAQGLQLTDARVGTQSGNGSSRDREPSPRHAATAAIGSADAVSASAPPATASAVAVRSVRLIDVIA